VSRARARVPVRRQDAASRCMCGHLLVSGQARRTVRRREGSPAENARQRRRGLFESSLFRGFLFAGAWAYRGGALGLGGWGGRWPLTAEA
jgi:hypothetical protein